MSTQQDYDKDCHIIKQPVTQDEFKKVVDEFRNQIELLKEENKKLQKDFKLLRNQSKIKSYNLYKEARKLISIKNNNLELGNILDNIQNYKDDNIKIVSIIASAKMGKSTLLNIIISKYNNYNCNVFTTSKSSTNHCSNGIDYFYIPELKIVFCDVQGLNHGNSSNDPKLLLITYLMSDIIIFTEPKMLNKNTLQTLSPLASFLTYLDGLQIDSNNSKPCLFFRISDFTLESKPEDNLNKLLVENNDEYKNLIINIKNLFKDIKAFKTDQLDRTELKMLDANNFIGLLESDENGFNAFISELNEYLDKVPSKFNFENWYKNLVKFICEINSNNKRKPESVYDILKRIRNANLASDSESEKLISDSESDNDKLVSNFEVKQNENSESEVFNKIRDQQEILNRFRDQIISNNSFIASNNQNNNSESEMLDKLKDQQEILNKFKNQIISNYSK